MNDSNPVQERHWTTLMMHGLRVPAYHSPAAGRLVKRLGACPNESLPCGGSCALTAGHVVPCECTGDEPGSPGSCPA